ncbi:hypothetical protein L6452_25205 [Arctium lappa]|uniref:Uncharacterized protein n=1 Tax=Arctium lappa TaxID=4217 RepID=A0ACB9AC24_ARCLA|nr:hypothetical protein L6452_25205 [Arctium lappa]
MSSVSHSHPLSQPTCVCLPTQQGRGVARVPDQRRLVLPCDVIFFNKLLNLLERYELEFGALDLDDFSKMFSDWAVDSSRSCKNATFLIAIASLNCCKKLRFGFDTPCPRLDYHPFCLYKNIRTEVGLC